jgi:hypothetical protein
MRAKTIMCAGHKTSSQRDSESARLVMSIRCSAAFLIAALLFAVAPQTTRADFVVDPGTTDRTAPAASLASEGGTFLALFCEQIGTGTAASEPSRSQDDNRPAENDRQHGWLSALGDAANGGCGSSSSAPSGGPSVAGIAILNELRPSAGVTCSGRIRPDASLRIAFVLAARLLDPPR